MAGGVGTAIKRVSFAILIVALFAVAALGFWHRQALTDALRAATFEPSTQISEIVSTLPLTGAGERTFLATHPTVESSQHFNRQCAKVDHADGGHVLGCYTAGKIHLFGIHDDRLDGIVEVTAAHELLHAGYDRLRSGAQERVDAQLRTTFKKLSRTDDSLRERMAVYDHLPRTAYINELHSVLGTEVGELPDELEAHYSRWFTDRGLVVEMFDGYHEVFTDIQDEAEKLNVELGKIRKEYERRSSDYSDAVEQFNEDGSNFAARNENYEFSGNPGEFYRLRGELEARKEKLDAEFESLNTLAERYEKLRTRLQELSKTSTELDQHLNSELAPPTTSVPQSG